MDIYRKMAVIATKMNMANVSSAWVQPCPKLSYTRHEKLGSQKVHRLYICYRDCKRRLYFSSTVF
jgi:hypothetical protein